MAKQVKAVIKLQIEAGKANPAPPVGPALGQHGIPIMEFCNKYNEQTKKQAGSIVPVEITVYKDRSYTFITKTSPVSALIKKALQLEKGAKEAGKESVGKLTKEQIHKIAEEKMPDLHIHSLESAKRSVAGTARSMGIETEL